MSTKAENLKVCPPKLIKLEKALKLAESWVNNMSGSSTDESSEVEFTGRPARLGLGAKVVRHSNLGASTDPVERKLLAKLNAERRRSANSMEESTPSDRNVFGDVDDNAEDLESRSNAFSKKRTGLMASPMPAKKKQKRM